MLFFWKFCCYLIYRLIEHDHDLEIINDIDIHGDSIKVKIK